MKTTRKPALQRQQQGSALLVSLMVMVGLSLLGLGFVAISETESSISVNQRNYSQTLDVAEAGAKAVVEWFQNPEWATQRGLLPPNDNAIKTFRTLAAGPISPYTGYYKTTAAELLCDLPFKPAGNNRLFGDENSADIIINASKGAVATDFLADFNQILFETNEDGGRVTDIRIYAPPMVNATLTEAPVASGLRFFNGGTRYGVATVKVTATKYMPDNTTVVSQRAVKMVISDFPFPGPEGPLQSNTGISTAGAFRVHWGKVTSQGDMELKRPFVSIPWRTASKQIHLEQGYEFCPPPCVPPLSAYPTDPASADIDVKHNWLYELLGKSFEDPWYQGRARADITSDGAITTNQAYAYDAIDDDPVGKPISGFSNQFQNQDVTDEAINKREVLFPKIDYLFWKNIAQSGAAAGTDGIYYLRHSSGTQFTDTKGNTKEFRAWTNTQANPPAKGGFYFFDTTDASNPQNPDGTTNTTVLTPDIDLQGGGPYQMRGFIYMNFKSFGTQGLGGAAKEYHMPSETYRDVGYRKVNEAGSPGPPAQVYQDFEKDALNIPLPPTNALNGVWDYQDLAWSNGAAAKNGKFDVFVALHTVVRESDALLIPPGPPTIDVYGPVSYFEGCTPGDNNYAPANCSEPHEPYINFLYPDAGTSGSGTPVNVVAGWENPLGGNAFGITRWPKKFTDLAETTLVNCTATTPESDCTSNAYDDKGPLVELDRGGNGPVLDGVLYNEGDYSSTGNAMYYGSVLIRGTVGKAGNVDVFFDESLTKGDWQKRFKDLPRVLITSSQTDQ